MLQQRQDWINSILDNLSSKENNDSLASYILVVVKLINEQEILTGLDTEEWSLELKSSLQKWCSRINSLLTSKNDVQKWAGAILLSLTISSSDKLFKDHWKSWFNLLFTNLKSLIKTEFLATTLFTLRDLIYKSENYPDIRREFSLNVIPKFLPFIISLSNNPAAPMLEILNSFNYLLAKFPNTCRPCLGKIELICLGFLQNSNQFDRKLVRESEKCIARLSRIDIIDTKSGNFFVKPITTIHFILDALFLEGDYNGEQNKKNLVSKSAANTKSSYFFLPSSDDTIFKLDNALNSFSSIIVTMLSLPSSKRISIPATSILDLVCRISNYNEQKIIFSEQNSTRLAELIGSLTSIHLQGIRIFTAWILAMKDQSYRFIPKISDIIKRYLAKYHQWRSLRPIISKLISLSVNIFGPEFALNLGNALLDTLSITNDLDSTTKLPSGSFIEKRTSKKRKMDADISAISVSSNESERNAIVLPKLNALRTFLQVVPKTDLVNLIPIYQYLLSKCFRDDYSNIELTMELRKYLLSCVSYIPSSGLISYAIHVFNQDIILAPTATITTFAKSALTSCDLIVHARSMPYGNISTGNAYVETQFDVKRDQVQETSVAAITQIISSINSVPHQSNPSVNGHAKELVSDSARFTSSIAIEPSKVTIARPLPLSFAISSQELQPFMDKNEASTNSPEPLDAADLSPPSIPSAPISVSPLLEPIIGSVVASEVDIEDDRLSVDLPDIDMGSSDSE